MFSKYIVPAICATNLLGGAEASQRHRHLHKKDISYVATEIDTVTAYTTVTVYADDEPATTSSTHSFFAASHAASISSSSSSVIVATPIVQAAAASPTTLAKTVKTADAVPVVVATTAKAVSHTTTSVAKAATTTLAASTSGSKRGLAYNDASLVSFILALAGSKFSWAYNWGSTSDGISGISYVPMLWGPTHYSSAWDSIAESAVTDGTEALLSFNECDNSGQCNLSPSVTADYHKQYFNQYEGKIRIGTPSISSSAEAGQGLDWLSQFFTACNGNCAYDFCTIHWYGPGDQSGADIFLGYLLEAQKTCGKNLWVTEFAAISGDGSAFIKRAIDQLDNNSTFSFVEKYSYFMLSVDSLFSSVTSLSALGELYIS